MIAYLPRSAINRPAMPMRVLTQNPNIHRTSSVRTCCNSVRSLASTSARRCSSFASNRAKLSSFGSRRSDRGEGVGRVVDVEDEPLARPRPRLYH